MNGLCLDMEYIATAFHENRSIEGVVREAPVYKSLRGSIIFKPSKSLLNHPPHVKDIYVFSPYSSMSSTNISSLIQHFRIDNSFPQPKTDQEMFEELKYPWKSAFSTQGLKLQIFVYSYDDFVADNDDNDRNDNFELNAINKKNIH